MSEIRLRVEPRQGEAFERRCDSGALVFGRAETADVVLDDRLVSRRHARVYSEGDEWLVEDLGARNGTSVNGRPLSAPRRLVPNDLIELGSTRILVLPSAGEPVATAPVGVAPLAAGPLGSSIFRPAEPLAAADEQSAERLKALNDFHRALGGAVALDALLDLLLEQLFTVLRPEEGLVLLRRPDGELVTAASRRLAGASGPLLVSRRLIEEVVDKRTAALVTDVAVDERFAAAQSVIAAGVRSILAAPMIDPAGCVGMIALYSRAHVRRFGEADLELLVSLASAAALRVRNVALAEEAAARRVLDRELALAHDIQMGMLPREMPDRPELELAAALTPARAVGGDLYDFFVSDDALWFIVADAAGKGVGAALFMAMTRTLFRALAAAADSAAAVLGRMNAELARENDRQVFVTAVAGRLDLRTGELRWSNAGHPHPLRFSPTAAIEDLCEGPPAIALGIDDGASYPLRRAVLARGEGVLLFTDGVTDALSPDGLLFSLERLRRELGRVCHEPAAAIVSSIAGSVGSHAASVPQEDDITLLAIRFRGAAGG
ncbi:MAG TPA: SpoIIE family protein phosphatase [Vicinamibacterales bacterium]|nr:SpoIIE family protein phosphatase [Vicinamibacterales bacterium]